jgi:hypothetical protein
MLGCKTEVNCDKASLILSFVGKNQDSLSSFVLYKYEKGVTSSPIDSLQILNGMGVYFQVETNAINLFFPLNSIYINAENDWKFKLNSSTIEGGLREITLSEIKENQETIKCKKNFSNVKGSCWCMNELVSYKKNGITSTSTTKIEVNGIIGYKTIINQ